MLRVVHLISGAHEELALREQAQRSVNNAAPLLILNSILRLLVSDVEERESVRLIRRLDNSGVAPPASRLVAYSV